MRPPKQSKDQRCAEHRARCLTTQRTWLAVSRVPWYSDVFCATSTTAVLTYETSGREKLRAPIGALPARRKCDSDKKTDERQEC
jgi:hypothetical protein